MKVMTVNGTEREVRFIPLQKRGDDDDGDEYNLLCSLVRAGRAHVPSERFPCGNTECRQPIWVSNDNRARLYKEDWAVLCIPCGVRVSELAGDPGQLEVMTPESRAGLLQYGLSEEQIDRAHQLAVEALQRAARGELGRKA